MTTHFKFATYTALVEAGRQALDEMRQVEHYLETTGSGKVSKAGEGRSPQTGRFLQRETVKKHEKVAA